MAKTYDLTVPIKIANPSSNVDSHYGPYNSIEEAYNETTGVKKALRKIGKTVGIIVNGAVVEYWWKEGIEDELLVEKSPDLNASNINYDSPSGQIKQDEFNLDVSKTLGERLKIYILKVERDPEGNILYDEERKPILHFPKEGKWGDTICIFDEMGYKTGNIYRCEKASVKNEGGKITEEAVWVPAVQASEIIAYNKVNQATFNSMINKRLDDKEKGSLRAEVFNNSKAVTLTPSAKTDVYIWNINESSPDESFTVELNTYHDDLVDFRNWIAKEIVLIVNNNSVNNINVVTPNAPLINDYKVVNGVGGNNMITPNKSGEFSFLISYTEKLLGEAPNITFIKENKSLRILNDIRQ